MAVPLALAVWPSSSWSMLAISCEGAVLGTPGLWLRSRMPLVSLRHTERDSKRSQDLWVAEKGWWSMVCSVYINLDLCIPRRHWERSGPLTTRILHFQSLSQEVLPSLGKTTDKAPPSTTDRAPTDTCASEMGLCCHVMSHSSEAQGEEPLVCVHKGSKQIRGSLKSEVPLGGSLNHLRPLSHRAQGRDLESCVLRGSIQQASPYGSVGFQKLCPAEPAQHAATSPALAGAFSNLLSGTEGMQ